MSTEKKKVQLRTFQQLKAERINQAEHYTLLRQIKLMEKDLGQHRVRILREQRDISSKMKEVRRTSGHSALRLCPVDNDPQIKQSEYFTTKQSLSEKQLTRWRITETNMERRYRLGEMKIRKQHQYEQALVKLLRDIGVIPEDANIFKPGSDEPVIRAPETLNDEELMEGDVKEQPDLDERAPLWERFPRIFNSLLLQKRPTSASQLFDRHKRTLPQTKEEVSANAIAEYIARLTSTSSKVITEASNKPLPDIALTETKHGHSRPRASSAPHATNGVLTSLKLGPKEKLESLAEGKHVNSSIKPISQETHPSQKSKEIDKDTNLLALVEKNLEDQGFERLPQWKRQLLFEAPGAVSGTREKIKVRLTASRSQRRKELDQMVSENKKDLETIAIEANERRMLSREVMSKALIGALQGESFNAPTE